MKDTTRLYLALGLGVAIGLTGANLIVAVTALILILLGIVNG
uniref:Uncharacterized protein n=1 Tax=viral metagenome TaxID=1070528 RepID=A0A6H2A433_9ZZZZ